MTESFPRQFARTNRFSNGHPSGVSVTRDGSKVLFLRSPSSSSRARSLWALDVATGTEALLADPDLLLAGESEDLAAEEQVRRERMRDSGAGFSSYSTDRAGTQAVVALSGRLFLVDLRGGLRSLPSRAPAVDPRLSPDGRFVSYVCAGGLHVLDLTSDRDERMLSPDGADISWGLADFIAAEELSRFRGHWWSPDSTALLVARVDETPVPTWHIADPANPARPPTRVRYPAAGQPNALVTLWMVPVSGSGACRQVPWDSELPYLATVSWPVGRPALISILSRDQRSRLVLSISIQAGSGRAGSGQAGPDGAGMSGLSSAVDGLGPLEVVELTRETDPSWLDVVPGLPTWDDSGALLSSGAVGGALRLLRDGAPISPPDLNLRSLCDLTPRGALITAQPLARLSERHLYLIGTDGQVTPMTTEPGLHTGRGAGPTLAVVSHAQDRFAPVTRVRRDGRAEVRLDHHGEAPATLPEVRVLAESRTAVLLPTWHVAGSTRLPVLMAPYGGPHSQQVVAARSAYAEAQWLADQGFAVVIVDGRGTPGTPEWERSIAGDLATPVLTDQVSGLRAAAAAYPADLDLRRVGIRGWSFGGYLAALAVLDRPDVFHAAVAGAPVTDWALYDTAYTERYLGLPEASAAAYARCSLVGRAASLSRPLMLVHGLADDNVVVAHTLRLSQALVAAGRPHTVLPLTAVTHLAGQPEVAENLLLLQLDFLRRALA